MNDTSNQHWGQGKFEVLGGTFTPNQWEAFFKAWQWPIEKRWGIWEYLSEMEINTGELPQAIRLNALERVELFGESGHISARRDGDIVYWHYIGDSRKVQPITGFGAESYWKTHLDETFIRQPLKSALLWGEKAGNFWHDDRVGWARLSYPGIDTKRAKVNYWQFSRAGQVAFVWITGLQNAEEES